MSSAAIGMAAIQGGTPSPEVTNQQCGEIVMKRVKEILTQQGKGTGQALQVTRHIVKHYEEQGRLSHLHEHRNDPAWIGKWVTHALSELETTVQSRPPTEGSRQLPTQPREEDQSGSDVSKVRAANARSPPPTAVRTEKRAQKRSLEAAEEGYNSVAAAWAMADAAMGVTSPEPKQPIAAKLTVKQYQRAVLVFGDTFPVRELLKSLGLSWNRKLGGWIGTWSQRWGIIARLRDSPEVELTVTFDESAIQPPKQERHSNNFRDGPVNMAHINNIARRWGGSKALRILEKMSREGQM